MEKNYFDMIIIILGGISTLAVFSFLIKENVFYRFFEHLFIGISAALGVVLTFKNFLWPKVFYPLFGLDIVKYPDGTMSKEYNYELFWFFIPIVLGLFYYFIYSKKYSWLAKLVIGLSLGVSGGLAFKGFFNQAIPQIVSSFKPLVVISNGSVNYLQSFNNIIFVVTLLSVMYYFFFTIKQESKVSKGVSKLGRYLMMVCFGAFFGSTIMARLSLLVERLGFLMTDWIGAIKGIF